MWHSVTAITRKLQGRVTHAVYLRHGVMHFEPYAGRQTLVAIADKHLVKGHYRKYARIVKHNLGKQKSKTRVSRGTIRAAGIQNIG